MDPKIAVRIRLADVQARARKSPTFNVPKLEDAQGLDIGDRVQVIISPATSEVADYADRAWLKVTGVARGGVRSVVCEGGEMRETSAVIVQYTGELEADLEYAGLQAGARIPFEPRHVLKIRTARKG